MEEQVHELIKRDGLQMEDLTEIDIKIGETWRFEEFLE